MNKKIFIPALLTLLTFGLAACDNQGQQSNPTNTPSSDPVIEHSHQWASDWMYDDENHWHECIGDDCTDVNGKSAHVGGTATCTEYAECDDCGALYGSLLPHNFKNGYSYDANNHWQVCADCDRVGEYVAHTFDQKVESENYLASKATHTSKATYYFSCVCGKKGTETFEVGDVVAHTPDTKWHSDETSHWHECTVCEDVKLGVENHAGGTATCTELAVCEDCGVAYGELLAHSYKGDWLVDETSHWQVCEDCGQASEKINHLYNKEVATEEYLSKEATHLTNAEYFLSCECGAKGSETFEVAGNIGHVPSEQWYTDGENHWQVCTYDGCDAVLNKGAHAGGTSSCTSLAKCSTCGTEYGSLLSHEITEELVHDEFQHWYACAHCGGSDEKVNHVFDQQVTTAAYLAADADHFRPATYYYSCFCGASGTETFFVGEKVPCAPVEGIWHADENSHWLECECGQTYLGDEAYKYGIHLGGTATCQALALCDVCGFEHGSLADHNISEAWSADFNSHWHVCLTEGCDHVESLGKHSFTDGVCDECKMILPQETSIADLLAYTSASDVVVKVSGVVQKILNKTYGNYYLTDPVTGEQIYVYGLCDSSVLSVSVDEKGIVRGTWGENNKSFANLGVVEGDFITVYALVAVYKEKLQLNTILLEKEAYTGSVNVSYVYDETLGSVEYTTSTYTYGETAEFRITPKEGYEVQSVNLDRGYMYTNYGTGTDVLKGNEGIYTFATKINNTVFVEFKAAGPEVVEGSSLVFEDLGLANATELGEYQVGSALISFDLGEGSTTPKYYNSGTAARLYGNNTLTISSDKDIVAIIFTYSGSNAATDDGIFVYSEGTYDYSNHTLTIEGGTNEVVITRNATSGHFKIVSIEIVYAE